MKNCFIISIKLQFVIYVRVLLLLEIATSLILMHIVLKLRFFHTLDFNKLDKESNQKYIISILLTFLGGSPSVNPKKIR